MSSYAERADRRGAAPIRLSQLGIPYSAHNSGAHLVVYHPVERSIDFGLAPTTDESSVLDVGCRVWIT